MVVKFSGNMKYLFAMMDDETRFREELRAGDKELTEPKRLFG